jgi:hypothetical protein
MRPGSYQRQNHARAQSPPGNTRPKACISERFPACAGQAFPKAGRLMSVSTSGTSIATVCASEHRAEVLVSATAYVRADLRDVLIEE